LSPSLADIKARIDLARTNAIGRSNGMDLARRNYGDYVTLYKVRSILTKIK